MPSEFTRSVRCPMSDGSGDWCRSAGRKGSQSKIPLVSRVNQRVPIHVHLHEVLVDLHPLTSLLPWGRRLQGQVQANQHPGFASVSETEGQDRFDEPCIRGHIAS